jgi:iron complex outermembrane receptor protein
MISTAKKQNHHIARKTLALAVTAALASQVQAQTTVDSSESMMLEEVIVTATKRAVNAQEIPISIVAITGETLTALGIQNATEMEKATPGLKIRIVGNTPNLIMRGAGSAGTSDTAVPIYNDGLYRPVGSQALASYIDVERVEILRGPQGTLFGRNTLGGLMNIITRKPDTEAMDYGGAVTLGDYDLMKFEGFFNAPLGENVAMRISATDTSRDPYVKNVFNEKGGLRDADNTYARGQLLWDITDGMDINFNYSYWRDTANGAGDFGHKVIGIPVNPATRQTNGVSGEIDPRKGLRDDWGGGKDKNGSISDGDESAFITDDNRTIAMDYTPNRDIKEDSYSALFKWDVGFAELKANVGYSDFESFTLIDGEFSTVGSYRTDTLGSGWVSGEQQANESWQADVNLTSTGDGKLRWTAGYFYFKQESFYAWLFGDTIIGSPQENTWAHWLHSTSEYSTKSNALYGQADYDITDDLVMTVGLRYSDDKRTSHKVYIDTDQLDAKRPVFLDEPQPGSGWKYSPDQKGSDSNVDYRVALAYNVTDDVMIYGSAASGYIAGTTTQTGKLLDATEADSYEAGVKSTLLDGGMTLNATYYHVEYTGLTTSLLTINDQGFAVAETVPGGGQTSEGIEAELQWQATDNVRITSGFSWNNSKFDTFLKKNAYTEDDGLANELGYFDLEGSATPFSPDFTLNLGITYQGELDNGGHLVPGIFIYYSDEYRTFSAPYAWAQQGSYTTFDLFMTWYSPSDAFSVQGFINNFTDEDVITGSDSFSGARAVVDFNNPRQWGFRFAYNF